MKKCDFLGHSIVWSLLVTVSLLSCKSSPTAAEPPVTPAPTAYFKVDGTVFYSTTPISEVTVSVSLSEIRFKDPQTLTTKTQGCYYQFPEVREGLYWVKTDPPTSEYVPNLEADQIMVNRNIQKDLYLCKLIKSLSPVGGVVVSTLHPMLVWAKNDEAVSYTVYVAGEWIKGIRETSYTVANELKSGETYSWGVYGYNNRGTQVGGTYWLNTFSVARGL